MMNDAVRIQKTGSTVTTAGTSSAAILIPGNTLGSQTVKFSVSKSGADPTGLPNTAATFTASIIVNGITYQISVVGSAAQTFTTLLSEINTDLGSAATAALTGGNIIITSASYGYNSIVEILDTNLFNSLTSYSKILQSQQGVHTKQVRAATLAGGAHVKFGTSAVAAATTSDILVTSHPEIFSVAGNTHYTHIQATSAQTLNIMPLEV